MLGRRWVYVFNDEVHVHHGLLPLVGLLGDLLLPLLFAFGLADENPALDLFRESPVVVEGPFRALPVLEADEAEALRLSSFILHDTGTQDVSEWSEKLNEVAVIELTSLRRLLVAVAGLGLGEVLDVQVGRTGLVLPSLESLAL